MEGGYPGVGNLDLDPLFVPHPEDYYLSHTSAGQTFTSPAVDAGELSAEDPDLCFPSQLGWLCMDDLTSHTNHVADFGTVNMGYHYWADDITTPSPTPTPTPPFTPTATPTPLPPTATPTPKPKAASGGSKPQPTKSTKKDADKNVQRNFRANRFEWRKGRFNQANIGNFFIVHGIGNSRLFEFGQIQPVVLPMHIDRHLVLVEFLLDQVKLLLFALVK